MLHNARTFSRSFFSSPRLAGANNAYKGSAKDHLPPVLLRISDIVVQRGQGSWVYDKEDNKYLDFTTGIGVTSTGHCHPDVVKAAQDQVGKMIHAQQNCFQSHTAQEELIQRLLKISPAGLDTFFFANSGSEAVDNAVKIARRHTGKPNVVAFQGGFHGRTIGAMSLTSSKTNYRQGFQPLMPGAMITPYPDCLRCPSPVAQSFSSDQWELNCAAENRECCNWPLQQLDYFFKQTSAPNETAALIIEPIQGEGGIRTPPKGFLQRLRDICDEHNILLIFDEVQCGVARSGKMWGHEHYGVRPDMITFAKGVGSGFPIAGICTSSTVVGNLEPGTLGGTYGGNAVASAAAAATLDVIERENLVQNAADRGLQLMEGLSKIASANPHFKIKDVRGKGLMVGCEFDAPYGTAGKISQSCLQEGLLLLTAGCNETLRFLPALNINQEEMDTGLRRFEAALNKVF